jgi:glyoxylase-like metal-dependent hydrolase (beta-lactamase superfamily II)
LILKHLVVGALQVNCYILASEKGSDCVVIDPGGEMEKIKKALEEDELEVKYILLTHGHVDHVGAVWHLDKECGGEILMHKGDLLLLEGVEMQALMYGLPPTGEPRVDRHIEEGENIEVDGICFNVIHTPGHSPGGVAYRFNNHLFVGDTLFAGSIGRTDLPGGSFEELLASVREKLFPLGDDVKVYPGHGPMTTIGEERLYNPFFRDVYMA